MQVSFIIDHLATQKNDRNEIEYNFRDMEQVANYVKAISLSNMGRKPIFINWYGCDDNSWEGFINSINELSDIYSKTNGIRLRGVIVNVMKPAQSYFDINRMVRAACEYAEYYLYQGYITGVVLYDMDSFYRIHYFINPVSYYDGGKYRPNYTNCLDEENRFFSMVVDNVFNGEEAVDYSGLVAYPFA